MMRETLSDWLWLQRAQWKHRDELTRIQSRKLRFMVNHAFRKVPFYSRLYGAAGIDLDKVTNTSSLRKLPPITKQLVRDTPLKERTAVDTDLSSCLQRTTSGSTGTPITFLDDPSSGSYRAALWLRRFWAFGVRPQHKACVVVPGSHRRSMFSNSKGLSGFLLTRKVKRVSLADNVLDHVRLISKWNPDILVGPPSYYRSLIESAEKMGTALEIKIALACGEMMGSSTRKLIASKLNAEVFQAYGVSEAGGVAWECPTHSGYHINADSSIVEFLRDGERVSPGEVGEVCVTNLWRKPTPMIRYRVGDMATHIDDECSCGRGLPLIKEIQGRFVDFILRKDGIYVSPFRVMFMLEDVAGVAQYKVVQKSDLSIDVLVRAEQSATVEPLLEILRQRCAELFGEMAVSVALVDKLENPPGQKFRVVESQLTQ